MKRRNLLQSFGALIVGCALPKVSESKEPSSKVLWCKPGMRGCRIDYFMYTYWKHDHMPMTAMCGIHFGPEQYSHMLEMYVRKMNDAVTLGDMERVKRLIKWTDSMLRMRKVERCFVPELYDYDRESTKYRNAIEKKGWV